MLNIQDKPKTRGYLGSIHYTGTDERKKIELDN